jgi:tellurite resistance protein TehA-like permease
VKPTLAGPVREIAADLPPGVFSFVMATGIVSTAVHLLGWTATSHTLLVINVAGFALLVVLSVLRLAIAGDRVLADLGDHGKAPGFLTTVAGTCVLGSQFIVIVPAYRVALALWMFGAVLWVVLIYAFFLLLTVRQEKPTLGVGMNGTWMLLVVGTQAVSVLGTLLAPVAGVPPVRLLGATLCLFLLGCMFYLLLFSLIIYRFLFFSVEPADLTPPYWINMGAVAITTLSGSLLVLHADSWMLLREILPFLKGFTLFFWATATWWIPLLLLLGAWRHVVRRVPLRYNIQFWSMVFPIGMYTVATTRLSAALDWPALRVVLPGLGAVAFLAWLFTLLGLCQGMLRRRERAG